jgi:hypothetical protein
VKLSTSVVPQKKNEVVSIFYQKPPHETFLAKKRNSASTQINTDIR